MARLAVEKDLLDDDGFDSDMSGLSGPSSRKSQSMRCALAAVVEAVVERKPHACTPVSGRVAGFDCISAGLSMMTASPIYSLVSLLPAQLLAQ